MLQIKEERNTPGAPPRSMTSPRIINPVAKMKSDQNEKTAEKGLV
jgi:hypothetical protein